MPDLERRLGLDDGQLGLALLFCAAGAMLGVSTAGRFSARNGSHRATVLSGLGFCLLLPLLAFAPNWALLSLVFVGFGFCGGTMDVSMNANGVAVEKLCAKSVMSSLHGMFSLGGLVAAGAGWLLLKGGVSLQAHFISGALALAAPLLFVAPRMLPSLPAPGATPRGFVLPERAVLIIGIIAFCAFLSEGAMADWSAIYLRVGLRQSPAFSALGYFAFAACMTGMRFGGDALLNRVGANRTLRLCGLVSAVGMGLALWLGNPWLTTLGFASVGCGMATVAPVAFSAGGRIGGDNPDHAIGSVATMGYTAFLVGPALIGYVAKLWSLRDALCLVVVLALMIVALAGFADKGR